MPPSRLQIDRPIVLVGLMGAGKTTVGRLLAARLALPFVDADEEVERETRLTIPQIFRRFGEGRFREEERRVLMRLAAGPPQVIAAGGGGFADQEVRALLLEQCLTVWLEGDVEILAGRVGGSDNRPLLNGRPARDVLAALAETRSPAFEQAHLCVRSDDGWPEAVANAIAEALAERAR